MEIDKQALIDLAEEFFKGLCARFHMQIGPAGSGRPARAGAMAWPVVSKFNCRAVALSSSQVCSTPLSISLPEALTTPSPSKGLEASPRLRWGSSIMVIWLAKDLGAEFVFEKAGAASDACAGNRSGKMAQHGIGHPVFVNDRHGLAFGAARV